MKKAVKQTTLAKAGRLNGADPHSPFWMPWQGKHRKRPRSAGKAVKEQITRHPDGRATVRVGTRELEFSSQIVAEQFLEKLAERTQ